ncbi:MAG: CheR family methyltransferase [Pseudomonadota bacterium]
MSTPAKRADIEDIEVDLFVRALQQRHGYDFSGYAPASLKRRLQHVVQSGGFESLNALTGRVLREDALVPQIVAGLSVPVSEMFRNPSVFSVLRQEVFPILATYPRINIWQAGCAHGEEVYSLAILLEEAGLYERSQIYATDFSDAALLRAQEGIFPIKDARQYSENYQAAGGQRSLADYYHARYERIKLDEQLKRHIHFANHNLTADGVFCEAHLILCRNVLIYFNNTLQNQVLGLFRDSLVRGGFLCLGNRESIDFAPAAAAFTAVDAKARVFRLANRA